MMLDTVNHADERWMSIRWALDGHSLMGVGRATDGAWIGVGKAIDAR